MDDEVLYPGISQAIWLLILLSLLLSGLGIVMDILGFFRKESIIVSIGNTISFAIILSWGSKKARAP
jgi:hypothetical protein